MTRFYIIIFLSFLVGSVSAQGYYNSNAWKRHRHEVRFELGASNFLGEVGGRDQVGSDFVWDLEFSKTNFAAGFNYLYYLSRKLGFRYNLYYGKVGGDDALTSEVFRHNRNIKFQSTIIETGIGLEWQLVKEKPGNIYNVKSPTGKKLGLKSFNWGIYFTAGVAGFYYNPKGPDQSGNMVALRPLKTEGQGLEGGAKPYGLFSVAIPVGFGVRKSLGRKMGLKIELTHRFTFTDYIDDASTVYYDPAILENQIGPTSAYLSNPGLDTFGGSSTRPGLQRGDPTDRDGYMFITAGVYFTLDSKKSAYGRHKVRRVKASF